MTDRPILFSAPMVRALLDGRKTQTRRVLTRHNATVLGSSWASKNAPWCGLRFDEAVVRASNPLTGAAGDHLDVPFCHPADEPMASHECGIYRVRPAVEIGDRLWVRESIDKMAQQGGDEIAYRADWPGDSRGLGWRPSIHMPRWASRLILSVTDVRVERLLDISEADARAEGIEWRDGCWATYDADGRMICGGSPDPIEAYRCLWININGTGSWDANPWVAAITFVPRLANIDEVAAAA